MGRKVVTSTRIDEDVLREARELGLNVSKVAENALKEAIRKLYSLPASPSSSRASQGPS